MVVMVGGSTPLVESVEPMEKFKTDGSGDREPESAAWVDPLTM